MFPPLSFPPLSFPPFSFPPFTPPFHSSLYYQPPLIFCHPQANCFHRRLPLLAVSSPQRPAKNSRKGYIENKSELLLRSPARNVRSGLESPSSLSTRHYSTVENKDTDGDIDSDPCLSAEHKEDAAKVKLKKDEIASDFIEIDQNPNRTHSGDDATAESVTESGMLLNYLVRQ